VTYTQNEGRDFFDLSTPITKQTVFTVTALLVFITVTFIDWKFWQNFAYIFYGAGLVLLILVLIFGSEIKGAKAWFSFGGFSFQPAEIAKLGTALALSAYLSNFKTDLKVRQYQLVAIGLILVPVFLILLQPDAGSALTFFSFFLLLFVAGLNEIYFLIGAVLIATFILSIVFPLEYFELGLLIIIPIIAWYFSEFGSCSACCRPDLQNCRMMKPITGLTASFPPGIFRRDFLYPGRYWPSVLLQLSSLFFIFPIGIGLESECWVHWFFLFYFGDPDKRDFLWLSYRR
jgi:cell division protein FtsW (lipid II flippase)